MKNNMFMVMASMSLVAMFVVFAAAPVLAQREFGMLYLNGDTVRTFGNPSNLPHGGMDPLYVVMNGVDGQLGISGIGPGEQGFHGGSWAFHAVHFNEGVNPYLLTSDEDVMAAEDAGDITVTRIAENDFRCPVLP